MSALDQSVKNVIKTLEGKNVNFQEWLEQERDGKNRKTLVKWLEKQCAQSPQVPPQAEEESATDDPAPEVESVHVEPEPSAPVVEAIDVVGGGEMSISDLIAVLSEKRDSWQRAASCGLENIRVHLPEIKITVR